MNTDLQARCADYINAINTGLENNSPGLMIDLYADFGEDVVDAEIKRQMEAKRATQWLKH